MGLIGLSPWEPLVNRGPPQSSFQVYGPWMLHGAFECFHDHTIPVIWSAKNPGCYQKSFVFLYDPGEPRFTENKHESWHLSDRLETGCRRVSIEDSCLLGSLISKGGSASEGALRDQVMRKEGWRGQQYVIRSGMKQWVTLLPVSSQIS